MINMASKSRIGAIALAVTLVLLSATQLLNIYLNWFYVTYASVAALLLLGVLLWTNFGIREWVLTIIASIISVALFQLDDGSQTIFQALQQASFFAAFIYLVTLLKEAAQRSPSVLELGKFLTRQSPSRRYYSLALGGHTLGVLLNFGAISLLTPLILRGARAETSDEATIAISEQQQISALVRGFSWMIMWSPTALTQAVLFTAFPTANLKTVIILGLATSAIMILVGRLEDRIRWRSFSPHRTKDIQSDPAQFAFPKQSVFRFLAICTLLITLTYLIFWFADVSGAIALMSAAPFVMIIWLLGQTKEQTPVKKIAETAKSFWEILVHSAKPLGKSAYTLGVAGFIGQAAATLVPTSFLAETLGINDMPDWLFLILLPIIINLGGQIALSPILVVVFLAAIINGLPTLPADPSLIVFSLGAGWALSMSASPNASATLLIANATNIPPTTLTWRWNGLYSLICYLIFVASFILLTKLL